MTRFAKTCLVLASLSFVYIAFLVQRLNNDWATMRADGFTSDSMRFHTLMIVLDFNQITLAMLATVGLVMFSMTDTLFTIVGSVQKQLAAALKHTTSFQAFRADMEQRVSMLEQELQHWFKFFIAILTVVPLAIAVLMAFTKLASQLLESFLTSPKP